MIQFEVYKKTRWELKAGGLEKSRLCLYIQIPIYPT